MRECPNVRIDQCDDLDVTAQLPDWPTTAPAHGCVVIREFTHDDVQLAIDFGDDP